MDHVKDVVEGLGLTDSPIVHRRKKFIALDRDENQIIICSGRESEIDPEDDEGTENVLTIQYPVYIGIVIHTVGDNPISNEDLMFEYREQIRRALMSPISVAPSEPVVGVSIDLQPAIELGAIRNSMDVSSLQVNYDVCEPRFEI